MIDELQHYFNFDLYFLIDASFNKKYSRRYASYIILILIIFLRNKSGKAPLPIVYGVEFVV